MGHKTLAMTERYSHLIPDIKREAINKIADIMNNSNNDESVKNIKNKTYK